DLIKMISDFKRDHQNSVTQQFFLRRIKDLLAVGINVNGQDEKGKTALMAAASEGNIEIVKIVLKQGDDVRLRDNENRSALEYADEENQEIILILKTAMEN